MITVNLPKAIWPCKAKLIAIAVKVLYMLV